MKKIGIYIHIPFCESKCYYCDFLSFKSSDLDIDLYTDYLIKEIKLYQDSLSEYKVDSIFIGGGTPSFIAGENIFRILDTIYTTYNLDKDVEISIESNPNSVNKEKLELYKKAGINRISLGLQSMNNKILKDIGRIHTKEDFLRTYDLVRNTGFTNVNIDLMFNLPQQTDKFLKETLEEILSLSPEHISLYSLILEENTKLYKEFISGKYQLASEDDERKMYHEAIKLLEKNNYIHYEVSNFAKEGKKSRHNLKYWKLEPYLGVGLGAHSNLNKKRFSNYTNKKMYYEKIDLDLRPIAHIEEIDRDEEIFEYIIMNLRLAQGISRLEFKEKFGIDIYDKFYKVLEKNKNLNLLEVSSDSICFTDRGLDISNQVYLDFM